MQVAMVGILGVVGILSRYFIELRFARPDGIPYSTLSINCLGSFLIGVLFVAGSELSLLPKDISTALTIGLLGGFTTFSAFSIQTLHLIEQRQLLPAAAYFVASPTLGLLFAFLGVVVARHFGTSV